MRKLAAKTIVAQMQKSIAYGIVAKGATIIDGVRFIADLSRFILESGAMTEETFAQVHKLCNAYLDTTGEEDTESRYFVGSVFANLLHDLGEYHGFGYVGWDKESGYTAWVAAGSPEDKTPYRGDESRRYYFRPHWMV